MQSMNPFKESMPEAGPALGMGLGVPMAEHNEYGMMDSGNADERSSAVFSDAVQEVQMRSREGHIVSQDSREQGPYTGVCGSLLVSGRLPDTTQSPTSVNLLDQTQTRNWRHQVAALERQLRAAQQQLSF